VRIRNFAALRDKSAISRIENIENPPWAGKGYRFPAERNILLRQIFSGKYYRVKTA
jgi:hypothetical protein